LSGPVVFFATAQHCVVIPAKAGIQLDFYALAKSDNGFRLSPE